MKVVEYRASSVLYNFLKSNPIDKPILLPANICPIVPLTFLKACVEFDFVDIDLNTHAMDKKECLNQLKTSNYSGLLFVHSYGKIFDNVAFYDAVKKINSNFIIIDDKCLCKPDLSDNESEFIDLELFSTGYSKFAELSYGGWGILKFGINYERNYLSFDDNALKLQFNTIKRCLDTNTRFEYFDSNWLVNEPLVDDSNFFMLVKNQTLKSIQQKEKINLIYRTNLPDDIQWGDEYNNWRFIITHKSRDMILLELFNNNLFAGTNFPSISYMFNGHHKFQAESESLNVLNLFNDFRVDEEFAYKSCSIINKIIKKR